MRNASRFRTFVHKILAKLKGENYSLISPDAAPSRSCDNCPIPSYVDNLGIKGGQFYATSDSVGHAVDQDGVAPATFNATIASARGLPLEEIVTSPTGRPFKVAHDGKPISKLL